MMNPSITAAVITYNSSPYIEDCLTSIHRSGLAWDNVMVVDDGSSDETCEIVRGKYPEVHLVASQENRGHSHACNQALTNASTDWVVLIDHDTEVDEQWYHELCAALERYPEAGIVVSRAIFASDRQTIHCDGGYGHYLGNMILRNGYRNISEATDDDAELGAAGTTSMAVNREKAAGVGRFDEDFFIYFNDFEFSLRMRLAGYKLYSAPKSVIYHKAGSTGYSFRGDGDYPARRAYYILRNRWFLILKLYSLKTLILCLPPLLVYEAVVFLMSMKRGLFKPYVKAVGWIMNNLSLLWRIRRQAIKRRKLTDRELLTADVLTFVPGVVKGGLATLIKRFLDSFFVAYWKLVSRFLK